MTFWEASNGMECPQSERPQRRPVSASLNGVAASLPHLMKLHIDNSKLST
jgi:hypothetical protein